MAKAGYRIRELRFVIEDEVTHCYALFEAWGDCPISVQGWHYKAFPRSVPAHDILRDEAGSFVLWPQKAPETQNPRGEGGDRL